MTWSSFLLMSAFIVAGFVQYGLAIFAILDLRRRERLRGANKITWALVILCVPFIGPLAYVLLGTDGLPIPRPSPYATWPGRRWRSVRTVTRAGESLLRRTEVPQATDPLEEFPASHEPIVRSERARDRQA